jgi:hypothetical protein
MFNQQSAINNQQLSGPTRIRTWDRPVMSRRL